VFQASKRHIHRNWEWIGGPRENDTGGDASVSRTLGMDILLLYLRLGLLGRTRRKRRVEGSKKKKGRENMAKTK
jgi:hypothetical protein